MKEQTAARQLFLQQSFGVLSTISLDVPGYPFGSITPYCADRQGYPIIYISYIAQHTRNILADPRVSLTVFENNTGSDDVQARAANPLQIQTRSILTAECGAQLRLRCRSRHTEHR